MVFHPVNLSSRKLNLPSWSNVAIIGAGPVGLEAATLAACQNLDVVVFEKSDVAYHLRQWGHVQLFSPFRMNHSRWGIGLLSRAFPDLELPSESAYMTAREYVESYLEPLARIPEMRDRVHRGVQVVTIGKDRLAKDDWIADSQRAEWPFRLLLDHHGREVIHRTRAVIDASGVYSTPRFMGSGNIPAIGERQARRDAASHLHYGSVDVLRTNREQFSGRRILLVGGGHSAATALEAFAHLLESAPNTRIWWVNRSAATEPYLIFQNDPLPSRDRLSKLANHLAADPPSWLAYLGNSTVEAIQHWPKKLETESTLDNFQVLIDTPNGEKTLEVDEIIANVGYRPDSSLHSQLQVHECYATSGPFKLAAALIGSSADCLAQKEQGIETLKNPEPNFFILGNKSYGTNPTFLLTQGIQQIEMVIEHLRSNLASLGSSSPWQRTVGEPLGVGHE